MRTPRAIHSYTKSVTILPWVPNIGSYVNTYQFVWARDTHTFSCHHNTEPTTSTTRADSSSDSSSGPLKARQRCSLEEEAAGRRERRRGEASQQPSEWAGRGGENGGRGKGEGRRRRNQTNPPCRRGGITALGGGLQEPEQAHRCRSMQPARRAHKHSASSGPPGPTRRPLPQTSRRSPPRAAGSATRGQACQRGAEADTPRPRRAPRALTAGCRPGPVAASRDRGSARTRPSTRGRSPRTPSTSPP